MRKLIIVLFVVFSFALPYQKAHALDAKGKAFLVICTYGTVGGALLGFASMAFGTNSRAIAQGASLGLYAGIAFGTYVITSHRKSGQIDLPKEPSYQDTPPPGFQQAPDAFGTQPGSGGGYGAPVPEQDAGGGFFSQRTLEINDNLHYNFKLKNKKGRGFTPPIYVPLLNVHF